MARFSYKKKATLPTTQPVVIPATPDWEEPAEWNLSERGRKAIALANRMHKTTAGLYSSLPLVCRGMQCKYHERCPLVRMNMAPYGEVCALEASLVKEHYDKYIKTFALNLEDDEDYIDIQLTKELIDIELSLDRANRAMAVDGDFIKDVIVAVANDGRPLKRPELHQAVILKEKLQKRKDSILKQLVATREAKLAAKTNIALDSTKFASDLISRAIELGIIPNAITPIKIDLDKEVIEDGE
jgi:hypothetical protein